MNNTAPFTFGDGYTFLEKLNALADHVGEYDERIVALRGIIGDLESALTESFTTADAEVGQELRNQIHAAIVNVDKTLREFIEYKYADVLAEMRKIDTETGHMKHPVRDVWDTTQNIVNDLYRLFRTHAFTANDFDKVAYRVEDFDDSVTAEQFDVSGGYLVPVLAYQRGNDLATVSDSLLFTFNRHGHYQPVREVVRNLINQHYLTAEQRDGKNRMADKYFIENAYFHDCEDTPEFGAQPEPAWQDFPYEFDYLQLVNRETGESLTSPEVKAFADLLLEHGVVKMIYREVGGSYEFAVRVAVPYHRINPEGADYTTFVDRMNTLNAEIRRFGFGPQHGESNAFELVVPAYTASYEHTDKSPSILIGDVSLGASDEYGYGNAIEFTVEYNDSVSNHAKSLLRAIFIGRQGENPFGGWN